MRCIARAGDLICDVFDGTGSQIGLEDARAVVEDLNGVQVFRILAVAISQAEIVSATYSHFGAYRKV